MIRNIYSRGSRANGIRNPDIQAKTAALENEFQQLMGELAEKRNAGGRLSDSKAVDTILD